MMADRMFAHMIVPPVAASAAFTAYNYLFPVSEEEVTRARSLRTSDTKNEPFYITLSACAGLSVVTAIVWGSMKRCNAIDTAARLEIDLSSASGRLAFASAWEFLTAFPLFFAVQSVALRRFHSDNASALSGDPNVAFRDHHKRYLSNTLEQTVLAVVSHAALSVYLPAEYMTIPPAMCAVYAVGRAVYWQGYVSARARRVDQARYRAMGFGMTYVPSVAALAAAAVLCITKLF